MAEEKMELRLINPLESEFLQHIDWNMDEIKAQVAAMMESYTDMVYTPDTMKLAKEDRAKLNKFVKIIEKGNQEEMAGALYPVRGRDQKRAGADPGAYKNDRRSDQGL